MGQRLPGRRWNSARSTSAWQCEEKIFLALLDTVWYKPDKLVQLFHPRFHLPYQRQIPFDLRPVESSAPIEDGFGRFVRGR
jgi:hypothetical protein